MSCPEKRKSFRFVFQEIMNPMSDLVRPFAVLVCVCVLPLCRFISDVHGAQIQAGVGKVDITDRAAGPVNDPLFAKVLVLKEGSTNIVLITIDAVAIGEIGRIKNNFLPNVRAKLQEELGIEPSSVVINASHCHGIVRQDLEKLTVKAVREAWQRLTPVRVGTGAAQEKRISENRRLKMMDGSEVDMRRAYSLPRDEDVVVVGPIDPQIGLLRIDRLDGKPLAVLYNFACHPIMNPPSMGNSADFPGFASRLIEFSLGNDAMAFFVQGCGGDINPVRYKDVLRAPTAEPLGNMLGTSVLETLGKIELHADAVLKIVNESLSLPRAADYERRIAAIQAEQTKLVHTLKPTDINFKTFLPLFVQHKLSPDFPSFYSQGYLRDQQVGQDELARLDAGNRRQVEAYLENIQAMERLTRLNVNLALLKKHLAQSQSAGEAPLQVEMSALQIGEFRLLTFPGELTVEIGLDLKRRAPAPFTFVAGYTNGYIYYLPTETQRANSGYAQEDCDCLVAPDWRRIFDAKALELLKKLTTNSK